LSVITLFGGSDTGSLSLCGTCLLYDGKLGYVTMFLDLELMLVMSDEQK